MHFNKNQSGCKTKETSTVQQLMKNSEERFVRQYEFFLVLLFKVLSFAGQKKNNSFLKTPSLLSVQLRTGIM